MLQAPIAVRLVVPSTEAFQKVFAAPVPASGVSTITLQITGPVMATITKTITVTAGENVLLEITVPTGNDRLFSAKAYDTASTLQYQGSTTVNLDGKSKTVVIQLARPPGSPDTSFGTSGVVTSTFGTAGDVALVMALQSDGKIVTAGYVGSPTTASDFVVVRYNADGTPDTTTFGTAGRVVTDFTAQVDLPGAVALQSDGKIVVVGAAGPLTTADFAVARYTSAGVLDPSFGTGGKVTTDLDTSADAATTVVIQSTGEILVGGAAVTSTGNKNFALARYTSAGVLDPTFGTGGKVTTDVEAGFGDAIAKLVIQAGGKIVAVGSSNNASSNKDFSMVRYNSNGSLDTSFGGGGTGKVRTDFGAVEEGATTVILLSGDRLLVGGTSGASLLSSDFALARYSADGVLDTTFGTSGKVTTNFNAAVPGIDAIASLGLQADGKIVAVGGANGVLFDFALARYSADGVLDATFGTAGVVTKNVSTSPILVVDAAIALSIQSDGKILAAGFSDVFTKLALVRFNP